MLDVIQLSYVMNVMTPLIDGWRPVHCCAMTARLHAQVLLSTRVTRVERGRIFTEAGGVFMIQSHFE